MRPLQGLSGGCFGPKNRPKIQIFSEFPKLFRGQKNMELDLFPTPGTKFGPSFDPLARFGAPKRAPDPPNYAWKRPFCPPLTPFDPILRLLFGAPGPLGLPRRPTTWG